MPDLDDSDPPNFQKYVNTHVTLDMLETGELVQELANRNCLTVITARRNVPRESYLKEGFYPAISAVMACDLSQELLSKGLVAEGVVQRKDDLQFSATIVVLNTVEDENPT